MLKLFQEHNMLQSWRNKRLILYDSALKILRRRFDPRAKEDAYVIYPKNNKH